MVTVDTRLNGWYIGGNLVFGGLVGWLIVDPLTGAMWTIDNNDINITMQPLMRSSLTQQIGVNVVLLQDVRKVLGQGWSRFLNKFWKLFSNLINKIFF
jgi:hypothetical protein